MGNFFSYCNNKPIVLLYGANGWIGTKVYNLLVSMDHTVIKAVSRADNYNDVEREILMHKATHIISCIGRTHGIYNGEEISTIDYLEKSGKLVENIQDNLYAPIVLASVCKNLYRHFTYLGTGCIFEYDDLHPINNSNKGFKENDKPNFFGSSYSVVKGYTDRIMHELYDDTALNIRIRMPITGEINPRNFITKITNYKKICSVPNSMTVLDELLPVMINYALNYKTGTVNLTNHGVINHNEILEMYKEIVDPDFQWSNFSIEEQNQILASKRSNNYLDTSAIKGDNVSQIKDAIKDVLYKIKNEKMKIRESELNDEFTYGLDKQNLEQSLELDKSLELEQEKMLSEDNRT